MDSETDILILKKIKPNDLNISTSELEKNDNNEKLISIKDNFKARFFAFLYKNINTKSLLFKPIGLKLDDEKIPEWNIFLVLMQSFSKENDFNKKLIKVCLPKDKEDDFYLMLRKYSCDNHEKGEDYILTRNQILEICIQLNDPKKVLQDAKLIKVDELDDLKSRLDKALKEEEYEEAAKLRDKIKEIS